MRRGVGAILAPGLSLLLAAAAPAPLVAPPPAATLPADWASAPAIALWPEGHLPDVQPKPPLAMPNLPQVFVQAVAEPGLRLFRPEKPNGRAILAIPGGGYFFVSVGNEGVDVARKFNRLGYTVYVLTYRLPGEGWADRADVPLQDARRAVRLMKSRAAIDGFNAERIAVLGFSAGGHLAATLATDDSADVPSDAVDRLSARPQAVGLIYPVITMGEKANAPSRLLLLGREPSAALVNRRSAERHAGADTPPLFLFHSVDDTTVPVENSQMMFEAMRSAKRPVEMHLVQEGGHGYGTGFQGTPSAMWPELFHAWLSRQP
ncbi:alpha/beta hydrolase [Sandaracinobacter sp. RS1-74]|uniref:alpha/beta hydrolase n=1 Tax=Sandaracinobacteroides sayramensis TaxID=2913411 RepID=UPI001EDB359F|nr:alpha/beta hydrolase [Sandaracinobacteroides sayramensis]MCG2840119.1 alpha/beta hydrolase [Sandaracinobacteroides sayramensis]